MRFKIDGVHKDDIYADMMPAWTSMLKMPSQLIIDIIIAAAAAVVLE